MHITVNAILDNTEAAMISLINTRVGVRLRAITDKHVCLRGDEEPF